MHVGSESSSSLKAQGQGGGQVTGGAEGAGGTFILQLVPLSDPFWEE